MLRQIETDSVTAAKAVPALIRERINFSTFVTEAGTTVVAVPADKIDRLKELVGQEEPKDYLVFIAVPQGGLPVASRVRSRSTADAVVQAYVNLSEHGFDVVNAQSCQPDQLYGRAEQVDYEQILGKFFVIVLRLPEFSVELRNDPLGGRRSEPGRPTKLDNLGAEDAEWLAAAAAEWGKGFVSGPLRHVDAGLGSVSFRRPHEPPTSVTESSPT